jgi:hypothetical protein
VSTLTRALSISIAAAVLLLSLPAGARDKWQKDHPRRAEVNDRLRNQNARIREGERTGKLSKRQAHQLHAEDHAIRNQERAEAAEHGGHITKGEQRQLNREENAESRQIYNEKH